MTFAENTVNAVPQFLDTDVTFDDPDSNFDGGTLTLTGLLSEDTVSVHNVGTGLFEVGLSGADVTYSGVVIGTLTGGVGTDLTITFNASATSLMIDRLIQKLTYTNTSDTPTASRDFVLNITDAAGADLNPMASYDRILGSNNPFDGLPLVKISAPTFTDLDGDGDLDLVVGYYGSFRVFDKDDIGTGFTELTGANNVLDGFGSVYFTAPTFVDLDGDGDLDMVSGEYYGKLKVYDKDDSGAGFTELTGANNPLDNVDVGYNSTPVFVDLDGDGDLDLVTIDEDMLVHPPVFALAATVPKEPY